MNTEYYTSIELYYNYNVVCCLVVYRKWQSTLTKMTTCRKQSKSDSVHDRTNEQKRKHEMQWFFSVRSFFTVLHRHQSKLKHSVSASCTWHRKWVERKSLKLTDLTALFSNDSGEDRINSVTCKKFILVLLRFFYYFFS